MCDRGDGVVQEGYEGNWSKSDRDHAARQGWGVFGFGRGLRIEYIHNPQYGTYFSSNAEAVAYVGALAVKGHPLARHAFLCLARAHGVFDDAVAAVYWSIRGGPYQLAERCIIDAG